MHADHSAPPGRAGAPDLTQIEPGPVRGATVVPGPSRAEAGGPGILSETPRVDGANAPDSAPPPPAADAPKDKQGPSEIPQQPPQVTPRPDAAVEQHESAKPGRPLPPAPAPAPAPALAPDEGRVETLRDQPQTTASHPAAAVADPAPGSAPGPTPARPVPHQTVPPEPVALERIVQAIRAHLDRPHGRVDITLDPPSLGTVSVTLKTEAGNLNVSLGASTEIGARLLSSHLTQLSEALRSAGIGAASVNIGAGGQGGEAAPHPGRQSATAFVPRPHSEPVLITSPGDVHSRVIDRFA